MNEVVNARGGGERRVNRRTGAREAILAAIRTAEPLSRVELAGMTGLTEASVSITVRRLLDEGLVVETGRIPTGGKPRTMLRLDPAARIAVGVHLDDDVTTYVLTGQNGGVISRMNRPAPTGSDRDATVRRLVADIAGLVDGAGIDRARCLGIGLVRAGPRIRPARQADGPAHPPGWQGDDLDRRLASATGWPVLVENDATAAAVGEYWVARVEASRPFAALYMGSGIGAGVVLDGVALRGRHASAGEFGHLCLQVDGPPCWCGSRGCLEAIAGPQVVVERALSDPVAAAEAGLPFAGAGTIPARAAAPIRAGADAERAGSAADPGRGGTAADQSQPTQSGTAPGDGEPARRETATDPSQPTQSGTAPGDGTATDQSQPTRAAGDRGLARSGTIADFAAIARAARAGAPACRALLEESARYVAAAAESVVNLLDVDLLVLTGPGFAAASFVYGPAISSRLAAADARTWGRSVSVTVSLAAATASATGAAALVLQSSLLS